MQVASFLSGFAAVVLWQMAVILWVVVTGLATNRGRDQRVVYGCVVLLAATAGGLILTTTAVVSMIAGIVAAVLVFVLANRSLERVAKGYFYQRR